MRAAEGNRAAVTHVLETVKRFSQLVPRRTLAVLLIAGALAGCRTEGTEKAGKESVPGRAVAPSSTQAEISEEPPIPKRLARAPANCRGPAPRLVAFADYGNLAGSSPVWAGMYATFDRAGQRYRIEPGAPRTTYGWRVKVLWVLGPNLDAPARIEGRNLANGANLEFEIAPDERAPHPYAVLDPATPGVPPTSHGYKEFPSYLYVPQAGCYELEAHWAGGRWRLVLGLGR